MRGLSVRKLAFLCLACLFLWQGSAAALDGSVGTTSRGSANIRLYIAPRVEIVSQNINLRSSPSVSGNNLSVPLSSNLGAVDYMVKPAILGSNSDFVAVDMQSTGVVVKGVMDDIQREYERTGEQVTLVLIAQERP